MNQQYIKATKIVKFLGIILDQKLTWESHAVYVVAKISLTGYLIKQLRDTEISIFFINSIDSFIWVNFLGCFSLYI